MSEVKLTGRKVAMFRTHIDPGVGPMPKQAFNVADPAMKMHAELTPIGVYVKMLTPNKDGICAEHIVPYPNIQSMKLQPEVVEEKRGPGRPAKEA